MQHMYKHVQRGIPIFEARWDNSLESNLDKTLLTNPKLNRTVDMIMFTEIKRTVKGNIPQILRCRIEQWREDLRTP